jgi:hypothetical protein
MPKCEILNHATSQIEIGIDFGGTNIYDVGGTLVYAPSGGTSISYVGDTATLNPLGLDSLNCLDDAYEIVSEVNPNTCNHRVTVRNIVTDITTADVYPFNLDGKLYELECQAGVWVLASCGGYQIQDDLGVGEICFTLLGTGEQMVVYSSFTANGIIEDTYWVFETFEGATITEYLSDVAQIDNGWGNPPYSRTSPTVAELVFSSTTNWDCGQGTGTFYSDTDSFDGTNYMEEWDNFGNPYAQCYFGDIQTYLLGLNIWVDNATSNYTIYKATRVTPCNITGNI